MSDAQRNAARTGVQQAETMRIDGKMSAETTGVAAIPVEMVSREVAATGMLDPMHLGTLDTVAV